MSQFENGEHPLWKSMKTMAASAVPTPATNWVAVFVDSTSGILSWKTSSGAVTTAGAWGSAATARSFVYADASGNLASTAAAADGELLIGRTGDVPLKAALTGTANRISVTNGAGTITLSGPQDIHSGASPTFAGLTVTGLSGVLKASAGVLAGSATTTDLTEGANLYYTDARVNTKLTAPGPIGSVTPNSGAFTTISASGQITSTVSTGTPALIIASTTNIPNLNASSLNGATFAAPGAIGGGTPSSGAFTTLSASGQITSTLATGTAPFVIASTTNVANLNASSLNGATFAAPGTIGGATPGSATFTTAQFRGNVSVDVGNTYELGANASRWGYIYGYILDGSFFGSQFAGFNVMASGATVATIDASGNWAFATGKTLTQVTGSHTLSFPAAGNTLPDGLLLKNDTASDAGNTLQVPGVIELRGHVWDTDGADNTTAVRWTLNPSSGATTVTRTLFQTSHNGGAWTTQLQFNNSGTVTATGNLISSGGSVGAASSGLLFWNARTRLTSSADGLFKATNDANDGIAGLNVGTPLTARTSNLTLTFAESGGLYTNLGASGTVNFTLPAAIIPTGNTSMVFHFYIAAAQTFTVTAAGSDTIQDAGTTSSGGGNTTAATIGNTITIRLVASGKWAITDKVGTWTTT